METTTRRTSLCSRRKLDHCGTFSKLACKTFRCHLTNLPFDSLKVEGTWQQPQFVMVTLKRAASPKSRVKQNCLEQIDGDT